MSAPMERLRTILSEAAALERAIALLSWDQQTYLPPLGIEARAEARATLERLHHQTFTQDEVGRLLEKAAESGDLSEEERALVHVTRRRYDREKKLPARLVEALAKATSLGMAAWEKARRADDFALFRPHLEAIVDLQIEKAEALGYDDDPYDALLDLYEPGVKSAAIDELFSALKQRLVPLVQSIGERLDLVSDAVLKGRFDLDRQLQFSLEVIEAIGFDLQAGRLDESAHPFSIGIAPTDVRLTTRVDENHLTSALYASIHEAGHGMYEQGLPARWMDTPMGGYASLGIHESQSRLWENVIGRSRAFWNRFFPALQSAFPSRLGNADAETMYRAVNRVEPSPIRVEADEVTYNLHIFLRYELERALIQGRLQVKDLPEAWNDKTKASLGFTPKNNREGVLQDIHWSDGYFGYFPTYALGSVLAVQLYDQALTDEPGIASGIEQGDFSGVKAWMQANVYDHGARWTPDELVARATGSSIRPEPYLAYVESKYGELYSL